MTATDVRPDVSPDADPPPRGPIGRFFRHLGQQLGRVGLLLLLLLASGAAIGLVVAYPLSFIDFDESSAQRLDQQSLAGQIEVDDALVAQEDLPRGWTLGDQALGAFGVLGSEFCGEQVAVPNALSEPTSLVWANPTDDTTVIAQAVRVDRWQGARDYVAEVGQALGECDQFFRAAPGGRVEVDIREASGTPPITDYVSAAYVSNDPQSVQEWSMMAIGDLIIAISHSGPTRPAPEFLNEVEQNLLTRIDPEDFAPGGIATDTTAVTQPGVTAPAGAGAADESNTGATEPTTSTP